MRFIRRPVLAIVAILAIFGTGVALYAYMSAVADPVVRRAEVDILPAGSAPVMALLLSDIHVAGPDMPPARLARIVAQAAVLRPDIVLMAGDFVSDKAVATHRYTVADAVAPLASLRPPLGTYAVLGNHDHWRSARAMRAALRAIGVVVLDNDAARAGPLAVGGLDDAFTGHDDLASAVSRMRALDGTPVLLSHSPDPFPAVPADIPLMLAGHTHCGQVRLPVIGAVSTMSVHGDRYACGLVRERGRTLIVAAGLGTSIVPLRLGAPPDMWLIRIGARGRR